ncbi:winged helix-turn-helix domain-containing protein [Xenorhabdus sp. IM139775]|uniref:winged helix-turn-helix domain-containing protein n=1 Tax=Xenorhabdus sp. IM139775 TaxID=3025876 RepID=UPI002359CA1C|nr:winged helix-turn-helix domain-containing protein [Xenorhabdus sp. IM139775]MDC9593968.1 winged helix-turn-helix domain-containing protein [Xenorhabdus sp. IM139775]
MKTAIFPANKPLQHNSAFPLYRQIYQRLTQAINQGILIPGQRIPSIRTLSSELHVSRSTVESAYTRLLEEGYLEARGKPVQLFHHGLLTHLHLPQYNSLLLQMKQIYRYSILLH